MNDNQNSTINLLDFSLSVDELQHWIGSGSLKWKNNTWDGDFALVRLLNGRLKFIFMLHDWRKSTERIVNLYPLAFEGVADSNSKISVMGIHFNMRYLRDQYWVCGGYAHSATRHVDVEPNSVSVHCELTNYSLHQRREKVRFHLAGFDISIDRLSWGKNSRDVDEHAIAYRHSPISTCLIIENIPLNMAEEAENCLREVASLLCIACRGHIFVTARHIWNQETGTLNSLFEEPAFTDRRWGRPLISPEDIEEFLLSSYPTIASRVEKLELALITDHYLQALTIHSIWPQSVGIFTAMETLKSAFFNRQNDSENDHYNYWIVPPEDFVSNKTMVNEIKEVLAKHYDRFANLSNAEGQSLNDQIRHGLKRRSYKTQLKRMLDLLHIEYNSSEVQSFIIIRNRLIHEGTGVPASTSLDKFWGENEKAVQMVQKAINLFERALLAFLNYHGQRELFDEGLNPAP